MASKMPPFMMKKGAAPAAPAKGKGAFKPCSACKNPKACAKAGACAGKK